MSAPGPRSTPHGEGILPGVLLLLLAAMVFYMPNQAQIRIDTGIRGLNVINILFILALGTLMLIERQRSEPTPLKLPFLMFFGVLVWAMLLALAGDSSAWVEDLTAFKNALFYLLLYFLFFHAVRDMRTVRVLVLVMLFVVFTSAVLGVRQAMEYGIGSFNENRRVSAPFGWDVFDANRSAVFFCIYLQLVIAAALFLKSHKWLRLACAGIFVAGVFVVFHTYSRQAYFILAVLALLVALRKHIFIALLAAVVLYHYEAWVPETVLARIDMTTVDASEPAARRAPPAAIGAGGSADPFRPALPHLEGGPASGKQYDESTESRFVLWAGAWELIQRSPEGIGFNRFKREITPYVPPAVAGKDAHNFYVLITTEAGVLAPLFLLVLLIGLIRMGLRLARLADDDEARMLGNGFVLAVLAAMMGNFYGSRFLDGDVMGNFWILAALVARTIHLKEQQARDTPARPATAAKAVAGAAHVPVAGGTRPITGG